MDTAESLTTTAETSVQDHIESYSNPLQLLSATNIHDQTTQVGKKAKTRSVKVSVRVKGKTKGIYDHTAFFYKL